MTPTPIKPTIDFADFEKIDIRVGRILEVQAVEGSDKLMRLLVDLGSERRNVLAGIKQERADPSTLRGVQALFVVNLEPRRMMGERSEAMLFDLGYADGIQPCLAVPEREVPEGTRAG